MESAVDDEQAISSNITNTISDRVTLLHESPRSALIDVKMDPSNA